MPPSKKVGWSQLRVGIMAMVAMLLVAVLIFLMTGAESPFTDKALLYTYMGDSAAMTEGSAVRLNGILVGKVKRIELAGGKVPQRTIRMVLQVEQQTLALIPDDSIVGFSAENVLGAKFLNIKRGESPAPIKAGGELRAKDEKDFLEVVQSAMPLLESIQSILGRVDKIVKQVEEGKGSIGKLIYDDELYQHVNRIVANTEKITDVVKDGQGTFGKLLYDDGLYTDVRRTLARLDVIADGLQRGEGTAGKLLKDPALYDELRKSSTELKTLIADLNAGKGTAGRLLKDETLHTKITGTLDRLNSTMDKVNAGQGTLGQLMVNPALYENLAATSAEMKGLMKDFRANPKKFLTIQLKLF